MHRREEEVRSGEYVTEWSLDPDLGAEVGERRERIVRCRDCGFSKEAEDGDLKCIELARLVEDDDHCSWGWEA